LALDSGRKQAKPAKYRIMPRERDTVPTRRRSCFGPWCVVVLSALFAAVSAAADPAEDPEAPFEALDLPFDFSTPLPAPKAPLRGIEASRFVPKPPKTDWGAKLGVDKRAVLPDSALRPERYIPAGPEEPTAGVAWANVTAPGLMIMDKTSFESRLDPQQQGKLGLTMSRTVPLSSTFSVTWLNGYAVTQSLTDPAAPATASQATAPVSTGAQVFDSNQAIRLTILPSDTALSLGATISSTSDKWMRSMSAEQKLFGGPVSVTGTVEETPGGDFSKSVKAGFKRSW
jgi:hypothetical protein